MRVGKVEETTLYLSGRSMALAPLVRVIAVLGGREGGGEGGREGGKITQLHRYVYSW